MEVKEQKFKLLLKKIFQYDKDKIDLDFGVYRVFRHKEDEIQNFVEIELPNFLESHMGGVDKATVYNHCLEFFECYFRDGDFYPVPVYATDKNHILTHNGEEVVFSWANQDQYYIKSLDNFSVYRIKSDDLYHDEFHNTHVNMVNFVVNEIDDTKGNNKVSKLFTLSSKPPQFVENEGFNIYLDYKNKSKDIFEITADELHSIIENAQVNLTLEEIEHHLKKFTNLRKTDFFIHKRLEAFLNEQLDYYLKTKVLKDLESVNEVDLKNVRVVKVVAEFIIAFIASLEELQKLLWEKKKFAYDVNYIITLDKLSSELLDEIILLEDFDKQVDEWIVLGFIIVFDKENYRNGLLDELKSEYFYLPLDTKFFDESVRYRILEECKNLEDALDGVLINSDNFHGLNYLQNRFREKIKCVYIDPPYNTGNDGFAYKDNYQHSSWLSLMGDRLEVAKELLSNKGIISVHLDENEFHYLKVLMDEVLGREYFINSISIRDSHPSGLKVAHKIKTIIKTKSQIACYSKSNDFLLNPLYQIREDWDTHFNIFVDINSKDKERYSLGSYVKQHKIVEKNFKLDINALKNQKFKKFCFENRYCIFQSTKEIPKEAKKLSLENKDKVIEYKGGDKTRQFALNGRRLSPLSRSIWNIGFDGYEKEDFGKLLCDFWDDIDFNNSQNEGGVSLSSGKKPEFLLARIISLFSNEEDIILDFFAGSGTTPAVAHKMHRKYLAVELGEYFEELLIKRMKYTFYGNSGGVKSLVNGGFLKYLSLEQYEDTLENSQLHSTKEAYVEDLEKLKEFMPELYASKYLTLYKDFSLKQSKALLMNEEVFNNPFDFTLKVNIESETVEKKMDLVETFNTLKGLEVQTIKARVLNGKRYVFVSTENEIVVWREFDKTLDKKEELVFLEEQSDLTKELYINGITQTHTKKELVAKELVFELRALLVAGMDLND